MPGTIALPTVSVLPTVNAPVPDVPSVDWVAEGNVVKGMLVDPAETLPPVVLTEKLRLGSPFTEKASAVLVEPGTNVTPPVVEPAPAGLTTTVPPLPTVNLPKLSVDPPVWLRRL